MRPRVRVRVRVRVMVRVRVRVGCSIDMASHVIASYIIDPSQGRDEG